MTDHTPADQDLDRETNSRPPVRIPLRWTDRKRLVRCLVLIIYAVLGSIVFPAPLLLVDPVIYFIGIACAGTLAILVVKRRMDREEKESIRTHGPFIGIGPTHISFPAGHVPAELPIEGTRISRWHIAASYSAVSKVSTPPMAFVMFKGHGHHITLSGCDFIDRMAPFPLISAEESRARTSGSRFIAVDPEALLRGYDFILKNTVEKLARQKAEASSPEKPSPLMKWGLTAAQNRALIQAGADIHATDSEGRNALAHQALPPGNFIGYCKPDLEALQVLLDAGISPPDAMTVERWKTLTRGHATSALEFSEATAFCEWLDRIARVPR